MTKKIPLTHFLALILTIFLLIIVFANLKAIKFNCLNAVDFGIYQQALYELSAPSSYNPYLTIRDLHIFSDHFEPILLILSPLVSLTNYHPSALIIFEWFILVFFIFLNGKLRSKLRQSSYTELILIAFITLFTKGFLTALVFPVHPAFWSIIAGTFLTYFLIKDNFIGIFFSCCSILLFRETYVFGVMTLSLFFLFKKEFKRFLILLILGVLYFLWVYKLRFIFFPKPLDYADVYLRGFFEEPLVFLKNLFFAFDYLNFLKIFGPVTLIIVYLNNRTYLKNLIPILFFLAPLFAIHILTNKFYFQYPPQFLAFFLSYIFFHPNLSDLLLTKKLAILIILLLTLTSSSIYTKWIKLLIFDSSPKCTISKEKEIRTQELISTLNQINLTQTIATTGGIVPQIMKPNLQIYQFHQFSKPLPNYDYLLLEKNNSGDIFPKTSDQINTIIKNCSSLENSPILDNDFYILIKGPIPYSCLGEK